ncbi:MULTISPECIES: YqaA family protein [Methylobacterium]|uniref:YqaA family protein n=1 Tax=Methylobacterium TaxID=407 RepID=UPI001405162B|nr:MULTISPECIES: VTT domain-containing protein [Methylobacterium]MDR7039592.1 membrane protein YqaA with SNARE-associated domain [Methylobacterium sp. BE186]
MDALPAFVGLFVTALIAGTFLPFLPGSSEMAMAGLMAAQAGSPVALVATAVAGNVTGATVNYLIGRNLAGLAGRRWFPLSPATLDKAAAWFERYGVWALALCWLPTFGDAVTTVAGLLRADLRLFLPLVLLGKLFGHGAVALGLTWLIGT